jgi:hypothetical protein
LTAEVGIVEHAFVVPQRESWHLTTPDVAAVAADLAQGNLRQRIVNEVIGWYRPELAGFDFGPGTAHNLLAACLLLLKFAGHTSTFASSRRGL